MDLTEIIQAYYSADGFHIYEGEIPEQLAYAPDLMMEKDAVLRVFYFRNVEDRLRDTIVQRISQAKRIPAKTLELFIAFNEKPKMPDLSLCKTYALGVIYVKGASIEQYAECRPIKGRVVKKQLPNTKIFFSSRQHLEERRIARENVDLQRESHKVPIFANLVEDDQRYENKIDILWDIIEDYLFDSQYVLCIVAEEHRDIIEREILHAIEHFDAEEIVLFVKNNKETKEVWRRVLEVATLSNIKYTEYIDTNDFKIKFNRRLMILIAHLHKTHGMDFP